MVYDTASEHEYMYLHAHSNRATNANEVLVSREKYKNSDKMCDSVISFL